MISFFTEQSWTGKDYSISRFRTAEPPVEYRISGAMRPTFDVRGPAFTVMVTELEDAWLAECDQLGLVTEADDYATLQDRARAIAPELARMNGYSLPEPSLEFRMTNHSHHAQDHGLQ
uniref:DUF1902 domain-containing protein n=1 Tax=Candidatus Kentrum sp. MB TaxID=2138164 RepID=A0A450XPJ3_9GAMM|nr:MAG: protein of unknown function (DUF1902) [Candidatus Kentron sp. MB]VFK31253.1 MAG: protein of unknown function (DUF1902) [Candidatus Kentron sp. MB]VFK75418.1 MAG: protein of unknown function (DUF1902) [Candidatus Kentron sp. MB]